MSKTTLISQGSVSMGRIRTKTKIPRDFLENVCFNMDHNMGNKLRKAHRMSLNMAQISNCPYKHLEYECPGECLGKRREPTPNEKFSALQNTLMPAPKTRSELFNEKYEGDWRKRNKEWKAQKSQYQTTH